MSKSHHQKFLAILGSLAILAVFTIGPIYISTYMYKQLRCEDIPFKFVPAIDTS